MADYQLQSSRFHKEANFSSLGVIAPDAGHKIYGERSVRFVVENVLPNNRIELQGKLAGQKSWDTIGLVDGPGSIAVDIADYDYIRFECSIYQPEPNKTPKLIASGFYNYLNGNSELERLVVVQNDLLNRILCTQHDIYKELEKLNVQLLVVTDEEI